jgi:lysophospholipase L1-like esterase
MSAPLRLARLRRLLAAGALAACCVATASARWVGAWATAPLAEPATKDAQPLAGATLRQVVRPSLGGETVRVRFSNAFGATPLVFTAARLALAAPSGALRPGTDTPLTFNGQPGVSIPPGASYLSDPVKFPLPAFADVAISLQLAEVPATLTIHGGSRTTSYLQSGDALSAPELPAATRIVRWYFVNGLEVDTAAPDAAAIVMLGDSITDGYGVPPDSNLRLTDHFARRAAAAPGAAPLGVLNVAIGGNRLTGEGLGPNALARFERDVLGQSGARWLLVFAGINDLGARAAARAKGQPFPSADEIIGALRQLAARARAQGLRVLGGTMTPYEGAQYFTPDGEADRQRINDWIRTGGAFDVVVDFDAAVRDPAQPSRLDPRYDSGDHLHPSTAGYERLGSALPLPLVAPRTASP